MTIPRVDVPATFNVLIVPIPVTLILVNNEFVYTKEATEYPIASISSFRVAPDANVKVDPFVAVKSVPELKRTPLR